MDSHIQCMIGRYIYHSQGEAELVCHNSRLAEHGQSNTTYAMVSTGNNTSLLKEFLPHTQLFLAFSRQTQTVTSGYRGYG